MKIPTVNKLLDFLGENILAVCNNDVILGLRKFTYCDNMIDDKTNTTIKKVLLFFVIVI